MTQAMAGCSCWWAGATVHPALFLLPDDAALDRIREACAGTHAEPLAEDLDREQEAALWRALDADADLTVRRTSGGTRPARRIEQRR